MQVPEKKFGILIFVTEYGLTNRADERVRINKAFPPLLLSFLVSVRPSGWSRTHPSISIGTKSLFLIKKKKEDRVPLGARIRNSNRSQAAV